MQRDLSFFGTTQWPIRPSSLLKLLRCEMSVLVADAGEGNVGAQTGSVLHAGVEAFHRSGSASEGLRAIRDSALKFPRADVEKAAAWYDLYLADPENRAHQLQAVETQVSLDFHGVFIQGTLDQLRWDEAAGAPRVWDLKTGSYLSPEQMLDEYRLQQAAYVLAARATLDPRTLPGGIIRVAGLGKKRGRVWLRMRETTAEECEALLLPLVEQVRRIRTGATRYNPSREACKFCPFSTCEVRVQS